jgi:hypothetical protein
VLSRIANVLRDVYADIVVNTGGVRTNLRRLRTKIADTRALSAARHDEPWLAEVTERIGPCRRRLRGRYSQYTDFVSNPGNALSLQSSALVYALCETLRPASVLDLGSGFSSYVVGTYQAESTHTVLVRSVDDSREWLERTRDYLERVGLPTEGLRSLSEFEASGCGIFDLVIYDLGSMETRKQWLKNAMLCIKPLTGVAVVDDCHIGDFASDVASAVRERRGRLHDVAGLTRDRFGRRSYLVTGLAG